VLAGWACHTAWITSRQIMRLGIVTISYNQSEFLAQAIQSVQVSNRAQLDYVVVDPGSTDGSRNLILSFQDHVSKIIFEPDQGPADGLNRGFSALPNVDILGYLNSDDCYAPGALDYVRQFFESYPSVDVLNGAIKIMDQSGHLLRRGRTSDQFSLARYSTGTCLICQQATFFRRSAFDRTQGFNIQNRTCWDGELMVDLAIAGCRFATTQRVLGYFRIHDSSVTGSQRLQNEYLNDERRIRIKIANTGAIQYPRFIAKMYQLVYKLDPIRHLSYFTAR
jgi:GT2 family glycosyltransferase